jgi:hypothetical protein
VGLILAPTIKQRLSVKGNRKLRGGRILFGRIEALSRHRIRYLPKVSDPSNIRCTALLQP